MKINEILVESLSRVAYHYTNIHAASKILQTGNFELSSTLGAQSEEHLNPQGYPYFLSTTRTLTGGYHAMLGEGSVMFVLDGNWFNERYKSKPVDYWGNRDPQQSHHRTHEAEDRVFSKTPTIPIGGVTSIHVLIKKRTDQYTSGKFVGGWARTVFINAKKRGIKAYLYHDERAWRALDIKQAVSLSDNPTLRGPQSREPIGSRFKPKGYLYSWIQLITATDQSHLSKDADSLRRSIGSTYYAQDAARGLSADMSNARKPSSGIDRENAIKIIDYMRQHKLNSIPELIEQLRKKWHPQS